MKRPQQQTGAVSFMQGSPNNAFSKHSVRAHSIILPGKGKPLELEDLSWVPEDLRIGYHVLKNAHVLPPEVELLKDIPYARRPDQTRRRRRRAPRAGQKHSMENDPPRYAQAPLAGLEFGAQLQPQDRR